MKNTKKNAQKILSKHCGLNNETATGISVINAMTEYAELIVKNNVDLVDVSKSKFVFVRYLNWQGQEKMQVIAVENEEMAKEWLKCSGFKELEVKQIYFY